MRFGTYININSVSLILPARRPLCGTLCNLPTTHHKTLFSSSAARKSVSSCLAKQKRSTLKSVGSL
jgi:hypothetical protein